ncbi:hypothetical protein K2173_009298 [Erythroxylum novogranatense]|uniref:Reverse transcriptase zinc-binding domain-containing protein n=1 Tax=Erythroxylum novogranatense TaxID=1862640 RepID=A0AAV8SYT6_9ROSI|nr:hypothetical protein K2173_009298 [Erythroxylum novogranatense]
MRLFLKLKKLKVVLRELNKECYADISQRVVDKRKELDDLQLQVMMPNVDMDVKLHLSVIWKVIRPFACKVDWNRVVWCPLYIPRHSFFSWLALLNRLPTKDRLQSWGLVSEVTCVTCSDGSESRDHLFMGCSYAHIIWKELLLACGISRSPTDWLSEFTWLIRYGKGTTLRSVLLRLSWNSFIYWIWRERNARLFCNAFKVEHDVLALIKESVRIKVLDTKFVVVNSSTAALCSSWNIG